MMTAVTRNVTTDVSRGPWLLEIEARIRFTGPLHVGTGERLGLGGDAPLLRDANDGVWLPGSSVRGVLRDWTEREAPLLGVSRDAVLRLFGATPDAHTRTTTDRQGRLRVFDVELAPARSDVRDHVSIDRRFGAARRAGKFDLESAEVSTGMLRFTYEGSGDTDEEVVLLRAAVDALRQGYLAFGGRGAWGLGAATAEVTAHTLQRSVTGQCAAYLAGRLPSQGAPAVAPASLRAPVRLEEPDYATATPRARSRDERVAWSWLRLDLELQFDGPMLVAGMFRPSPRAGELEREADATYIATLDGEPILPGSSLRGALRSHAERITRTLGCSDDKDPAKLLFGTTARRGILRVGEGTLVGDPRPVFLNHVAIDRITGFAADKKLFSAAALASPLFRVRLFASWDSAEEQQQAALGLLLMVLRDAQQKQLWVGSRATRGYGWLEDLSVAAMTGSFVADNRRVPLVVKPRKVAELDGRDTFEPLLTAWRKVSGVERELEGA